MAADYSRLCDEAFAMEESVAHEAFSVQAERLLARIENPKRKRRFWR